MILAKIWYKTHNNKVLFIVKAYKTWQQYLKNDKHNVFILMNYNNFCYFIDIKNSSFCQVY